MDFFFVKFNFDLDRWGQMGVILGNMGYQRGNRVMMLVTNVLLAFIVQYMMFCEKNWLRHN